MPEYNGHPNRHYWNVALWVDNDYGTYQFARECLRRHSNVREAVTEFTAWAAEAYPNGKTPDGYAFTPATVRHALVQLRRDEPELRPRP